MVQKSLLTKIIATFDPKKIEQHLVQSYLKSAKLDFSKSKILTDYFSPFEQIIQLQFDSASFNISSTKELENYLELIIPESDRKFNGAFFTPDFIVDFIINELEPKVDDINLDPSCGSGAFLIGLVDYYKRTFKKSIRSIVKENVYGSDILDYNIYRAKLILSIYALQNGEILEENDFNLYTQDSLKTKWDKKFDNIIGNPPYVKFQDLSDENRKYLAENWTTVEGGTFNLYFAFFELGYKLLSTNGKLGYITPNNYFTSLAGEALRKYFQDKKCLTRIIDFSHKRVFDAQTYTAITFLNRSVNDSILYDRISDDQNPQSFLLTANGSPNNLNELSIKKWRLLKTDEQQNIKTIESIGAPIGKLFDICVGIATLKDEVFFVDGNINENGCFIKSTSNGNFEIEREVTKPVYKISDFSTQKETETNTRRIICPYDIKKGKATAITEVEFKRRFPKCFTYLLSEREILQGRDKGKVLFEPFYVWGRTQGLTRIGRKILNPTFSQVPRFFLIEDEDAFFTNGYGIYFRNQSTDNGLFDDLINPLTIINNMDVVQKILNSYVMHYYISKTSVSIEGGYPCYQKNFIEKFTIPYLTENEIETLRNMNDKSSIDEFLITKYQLNVFVGNLVL